MKVAIDNSALSSGHKVRGIGVMVGEQIKTLENEANKRKGITIEAFDFGTKSGSSKLRSDKFDLIHYPYFFPFSLTLPVTKPASKVVVTIQDLIQLVYPKKYPPGTKGKLNLRKQKDRLKDIDGILTISEISKEDIVKFLGVDPKIVKVIYLAPKDIFQKIDNEKLLNNVKDKYKLPDEFVLYVGDVNYNKNIPNLIKACEIAKLNLVIVGKSALAIEEYGVDLKQIKGPRDWVRYLFNIPHPELAHYKNILEEFKKSKNVYRLGFVPEDDLAAIYNLASVYCQPSFYEGFGLPVLEAMASGCAVVASNTESLKEIAKDAALFVDPNDPKSLADNLRKIIDNSTIRDKFINEGMKRAKDFGWGKVGKETIDWYLSFDE
jgi:glycosyltransferase involved in cell wall biosynthesis